MLTAPTAARLGVLANGDQGCDSSSGSDGLGEPWQRDGRTAVFLWCSNRLDASQLLEDRDGMLRIRSSEACNSKSVLVDLERVAVSALQCARRHDHLEFRYVF